MHIIKNTYCLFIVLVLILFNSCASSEVPGTKEKEINGLTLKIKYIQPEELAEKEMQSNPLLKKDSLKEYYKKSLHFVLSLNPKDKGDLMTSSVKNYNEYVQLSQQMNFEMENMVSLQMKGKIYHPVLSAMENTYGMKAGRDIVFAFAPSVLNDDAFYASDSICFTYNDQLFNLGINNFYFSREEINNTN